MSSSAIRKIKHVIALTAVLFAVLASFSGCAKNIEISGTSYRSDSKELTIEKLDTDDYSLFGEFTELERVDVSSVELSVENYGRLAKQLGDKVKIIWTVPINGQKVRSDSAELSLSGEITDEDIENIRYFKDIKTLTLSDTEISENLKTLVCAARENNPDLSLNGNVKIYGVKYDCSSDILILNEKKIKSLDKVHLAVATFPGIKTIEMCDCGVSNEKMQGLREKYPEVKFVWTISFLKFKVRTDIQVFSTLANEFSRPGNSKNLAPVFKYCTELRALDLGHQAITDISDIRNLKKLHTLILADNRISDISPLAELKELVYIELFFNRIKDVSPLLELPNLLDVNLCFNPTIKNPTVLTGSKKLERLYISHCSLDKNEIKTLKEGIPENCIFNYTCNNAVFGNGWRGAKNVRNTKVREAFRNWRKVKEYPSWDNIIYK